VTRLDDRSVQEALSEAGDHAGAFLWRRVCRDLDGPVRVALLCRDDATARLAAPLCEASGDVEWVLVPLGDDEGDDVGLGVADRLLGCHATVAATPYTSALGAGERDALALLATLGAPDHRVVLLVGRELLERVSDDPDAEAADVAARAEAIAPDGWPVLSEPSLAAWLSEASGRRRHLAAQQRHRVAVLLTTDAIDRARSRAEAARSALEQVDALLAAEDQALDDARRRGRRAAAHVLGAVRRETERLLVDLRDFLLALEADLPTQIDEVADLSTLRRVVPHWLQHVVEDWIERRLATWRDDVLADLAEVGLSEEDTAHAELLVPALFPTPVQVEGGWAGRIGATVGLGGGAALALAGLWLPALVAITGGLAWSALGNSARTAATRRKVLDAAVTAVRAMGEDADRLLRDQIRHVGTELDHLGEERADELARARAATRDELSAQRRQRLAQVEEHDRAVAHLAAHLTALGAPA